VETSLGESPILILAPRPRHDDARHRAEESKAGAQGSGIGADAIGMIVPRRNIALRPALAALDRND
jgi:hypothetical protein